jgi:ribosomal subunit interface protein
LISQTETAMEETDMELPLEIVFLNLEPSEAVSEKVRERADKLRRYCSDIMSCKVMIEIGDRHQHKGNLYHVRVGVKVPDTELTVSHSHDDKHAHEDVYVAIRDAFEAMRRRLEAYTQRRRGHVKTHEVPDHGHIAELHPEADYGIITTAEGRRVYFHRHSISESRFDHLTVGDAVHFSEEMGDEGPQASTVHVEGKHHVTG